MLRGGHILESTSRTDTSSDARIAIGADYSYSHVDVVGDITPFDIHSAMGAADYELSPAWTFSGGAGIVYLQGTPFTPAHNAPTARVSLDRRRGGTTFHVGYLRSYIPSFGLGGTSANQEVGVAFRTPLFNNRHVYTDAIGGVPRRHSRSPSSRFSCRSARSGRFSIIGWEPDRWVRIEGFYALVQQTTLRFGGQVYRNHVGISDRHFQASEDSVMDEPRFDPLDYVSVFNRRKWWFIVPVPLSLIIGLLLVWKLPRTYQATTTIAVSSARLASNLVGSVEMDRTERMHAVSQQLLSRPVLERTVRLEHLDAGRHDRGGDRRSCVRHPASRCPIRSRPAGRQRRAPTTQLSPDQKAQLDSYQVQYTDEHARGCAAHRQSARARCSSRRTANRARCARSTRRRSSARELQASENRLKTLEERLRTMKEAYMGRLPEQTNANLQMVSTLQRQLESNAHRAPRRAGSAGDDRAPDRIDAAGRRRDAPTPRKARPARPPRCTSSRCGGSSPTRSSSSPTSTRKSCG